eukprot:365322-Chlamydomonas_euryale.AAC.8
MSVADRHRQAPPCLHNSRPSAGVQLQARADVGAVALTRALVMPLLAATAASSLTFQTATPEATSRGRQPLRLRTLRAAWSGDGRSGRPWLGRSS